jgi:hypothetical protein
MAASKSKGFTKEEVDALPEFQDDVDDEFEGDEELDEEPEDAKPEELPEGHDRELSFDDIIGATELDEEKLYIPEWMGTVTIRSMTKREFDEMRREANLRQNRSRRSDILERAIICAGVVKPVIDHAGYERLLECGAGPMVQILNAIYRKSGLEREAEKAREKRFPRKR